MTLKLEFFYLLIPLFLLILLLMLYLYVNIKKKKLDISFEKSKQESDSTTNHIYNNELRSLSMIKNLKDNSGMVEQAATMVWEIDKLKKTNYELSIKGKEETGKYKIFSSSKLLVEIKTNENKIKEMDASFFETVGNVLNNIKTIRSKINLYKRGLKDFKDKVNNGTSVKENSKSYVIINDELKKIGENLVNLDHLINNNDLENAVVYFSDIKKVFLSLIIFANNCNTIENMIFYKIPQYLKKLNTLFLNAQSNTKSELSFLSFETQFMNAKAEWLKASKNFSVNSVNESIDFCDSTLVKLSNLNNEINREIDSYSFINKHKVDIDKYKKNISKLFLILKDELKIATEIDKVYFAEFGRELDTLHNYLTEVDLWIEKINLDEHNYNISFSSKLFKFKSFYYQVKGFYFLYVELKTKIELFYLEGESNLLKFGRLSKLARSINSYVKNNNIILSIDEKNNAKEIEEIKQQIIEIIFNTAEGVAPNIVSEYTLFLLKLVSYVKSVGLKIEMSKMFKKTIKLLSHKRSSDKKLNDFIILSENYYLDGDYNLALDNLINSLNKGVN